MSKVIVFPGVTRLDINPDTALKQMIGNVDGFVVAGYDKDGEEFFSSTYADGGDALWLLERCKKALLESVDEVTE